MPHVRGNAKHFFLLAVQAIGVDARVFVPEHLVEAVVECLGLRAQGDGAVRLAECFEHFRHTLPGIIDVALQFAQRLGAAHQRAVEIGDGVAGILPALVLVALRGTRLVFLETVAVAVAPFVYPGEAALRHGKLALQQSAVAGPQPCLVQRDQV